MTTFTTSGNFIKITETKTGTSKKGTSWKAFSFLVDVSDSEKSVFKTMDSELINTIEALPAGTLIRIDFSIKTNEWQGKYYTELVPIEIVSGESISLPEPQQITDLPF